MQKDFEIANDKVEELKKKLKTSEKTEKIVGSLLYLKNH